MGLEVLRQNGMLFVARLEQQGLCKASFYMERAAALSVLFSLAPLMCRNMYTTEEERKAKSSPYGFKDELQAEPVLYAFV